MENNIQSILDNTFTLSEDNKTLNINNKKLKLTETFKIKNPLTNEYEEYYKYLFPIGTVKVFNNGTDPNNIYPGTKWERYEDNRFLRIGSTYDTNKYTEKLDESVNDLDKINNSKYGGSSKISIEQMPKHSHTITIPYSETTTITLFTNHGYPICSRGAGFTSSSTTNSGSNADFIPYHYKIKTFVRIE